MRRTFLSVFLTALLVTLAAPPASAFDEGYDIGPSKTMKPKVDVPAMPGIVVVSFRKDVVVAPGASKTGVAAFDHVAETFGVYAITPAFPFLDDFAAKRGASPSIERLRQIYEIRYAADTHPQEVAEALAREARVAWAEPRYMYQTFDEAIPADSLFGRQSHIGLIHLPEAWAEVKGEQGNVIIAIADGGTEWQHPDLRANVWTNQGEIPGNNVDDDNNGFIDDVHGWNFQSNTADPTGSPGLPGSHRHGTAVAGVASAVTNNNSGIAGASWNATLMPINVGCPRDDNQICFGYDGVIYAAANGALIINASWGGPVETELGREAIDFALESGSLVLAASGNSFTNLDISPQFPANYRGVLSVGATQKASNEIAEFSNYGRSTDIFVPGININATFPGNDYGIITGTSFSTPLAAGIAALVKTRFPDYTPDQLREQIRVTGDLIDAENDTLAGMLGQGRINAFRAVTEQGHAAIRLIDYTYTTSDGDSLIESGETVTINATLVNYLDFAPSASVQLQSDDPQIITAGASSSGSIATGDTAIVSAEFTVAQDMPRSRTLRLYAEIEAPNYLGVEVIRGLVANPARAADHTNGTLTVSVTDEGNIGFLETADPIDGQPLGHGFVYLQNNLLFEGGLVLGTDLSHISDVVRNNTGIEQNTDLLPAPGSFLDIVSPGDKTNEEGSVVINDAGAPQPIGITLAQESFLDSDEAYDDFIVFKYTITNTSGESIDSLFAGLFFDWDIDEAQNNSASFDGDRRLGYIYDTNTSTYVGTKLLTTDANLSYHAIDNPREIYDGFSDREKWNFLSGGVQETMLTQTDASQLMAAGPYALDPGGAIVVGFAIVAAGSTEALLQHADNAQQLWDTKLAGAATAIEDPEPGLPGRFALEAVYPNPTSATSTFTFSVARTGDVAFGIYDVLGRQVQRIELGPRPPGSHEFTWDGRDATGRLVSSGIYLCRYTATIGDEVFTGTRSLIVIH